MAGAPARRFLFEGRPREARPDETLLAAIARGGLPTLQRSIRYHRPRAPICGIGQCTGCLVRVNGRPNVRACRYQPQEGDRVVTENAWPSARFDVLGALDFVFPSGVDTLRGFRRPAWATGLYQRVVRRLAGYGAAPAPAPAGTPAPAVRRTAEVVVIGGGASGAAAAARLVTSGRSVLVVDRSLAPPSIPGADLLDRTTVTFLPPRRSPDEPFVLLGFDELGRGIEVRARVAIVATGAYDGMLLFGGNDRPGVLTADGALALTRPGGEPPFRRGIVLGGGARAEEVLAELGHRVDAVVAPGAIHPELVRRASELEIPLYPRTLVRSASGRGRVRRLRLQARGGGAEFSLACDAVILAHRRLPTPQLFFQAGARMEWRSGTGAYYPLTDPAGETSVPGLFAVGETTGALAGDAAASGGIAADAILGRREGVLSRSTGVAREGPHELEGYYRELLRGPRPGRWVACPCEDVLLEEIESAHRLGYRGIEVIKRYSGVGTGLCQGRYCLPDALLVLSLLEGRAPPEVGYITQRPPLAPTPLGAFASLDGTAPTGDM
ncbi:MAG TPA: 2Fe-2S iron-sulfur cluster-binding protein [Thermoplasmata archaeon]|nr:2Fe-2S iron-sulfur cluster-binding protein [Thermoplasmata archaeon]